MTLGKMLLRAIGGIAIGGPISPVIGSVIGGAVLAKGVHKMLTKPKRGPVQMFLCDHVKPIPGSVVCCKLAGVVEHSGVYVGNGQIVHRDGDGYLAKVGMQEFLERLGGLNPAITIFVSCHEGEPVGEDVIAQRALEAMGNPSLSQGYDLLTKNCHQFCQYCVTGKVDNGISDFTFSNLEGVLQHELGMDGWRVWDGCWGG